MASIFFTSHIKFENSLESVYTVSKILNYDKTNIIRNPGCIRIRPGGCTTFQPVSTLSAVCFGSRTSIGRSPVMNCEIIAVGDEVLTGDILNTNAQYIAACLEDA